MDEHMKNSNFFIPESILSDLCSRFIITVPEEERNDLIRIFFQIEIAHWFYLDFYCSNDSNWSSSSHSSGSSSSSSPSSSSSSSLSSDDNENDDDEEETENNLIRPKQPTYSNQVLKPCSIRAFAEQIFRYCPFLMKHSNQVDDILSKWKVFKHAVPTNGAIVLDESMRYVLLVQGFWTKASWGFPKGKIFEEETEAKCAIREVLEETGYDISDKLVEDEHLQININDQTIRLYLITNVPKATKFEPKTRREIKEVRWFAIDELPAHRKDNRTKHKLGFSPNAFFMVIPFVKALKKWIVAKKSAQSGQIVSGGFINGIGITPNNNNSNNNSINMSNGRHQFNKSHHVRANHKRRNSHSNHQQQSHHHHNHHHSSNNNNNSNHYHQNSYYNNHGKYHSLHYQEHSNNTSLSNANNSYRKLSKSNENLTSSINTSNSNQKNTGNNNNNNSKKMNTSNNNKSNNNTPSKYDMNNNTNNNNNNNNSSNAFLKHFSKAFTSLQYHQNVENVENTTNSITTTTTTNNNYSVQETDLKKQQTTYFQKLQQEELAELLNLKPNPSTTTALTNKTNNLNFNTTNNNKNYNNKNSNGNYLNKNNYNNNNNNKTTPNQNLNGTNSYNRKRTVSLNKDSSMKNSNSFTSSNNNFNISNLYSNVTIKNAEYANNTQTSNIRKQLNFNGPECWINFKFDYDSILKNLPPILDL